MVPRRGGSRAAPTTCQLYANLDCHYNYCLLNFRNIYGNVPGHGEEEGSGLGWREEGMLNFFMR